MIGGIQAIWNFTPFRIRVENIIVQNTSIYASGSHVQLRLNELSENEKKPEVI